MDRQVWEFEIKNIPISVRGTIKDTLELYKKLMIDRTVLMRDYLAVLIDKRLGLFLSAFKL